MSRNLDSDVLDNYAKYIIVPSKEEIKNDLGEEAYLRLINDLESPNQRIKTLLWTTFNPWSNPTHEAIQIREVMLVSGVTGLFVGGLFRSRDAHQDYQRQHNASVFENKYIGQRHVWDTLITRIFAKGLSMGSKVSLLCTSASLIGFGSIAYRNRLYFPDFLIGFGALGGISRLWLGAKAVLVGTGLGMGAGVFGYGMGKVCEIFTQMSVTQMRLLHHKEWLASREQTIRQRQIYSAEHTKELLKSELHGEE